MSAGTQNLGDSHSSGGGHGQSKHTSRTFGVPIGPAHTWLAYALKCPSFLLPQSVRRTPKELLPEGR